MESITENVYLLGFMGSGKTTIGKALAQILNRRFLDMDTAIAAVSLSITMWTGRWQPVRSVKFSGDYGLSAQPGLKESWPSRRSVPIGVRL